MPSKSALTLTSEALLQRAAALQATLPLRGSSEFHAWGDSNLYLHRHGDQLALSVEHRAAAAITAISLQLTVDGDAVALTAIEPAKATTSAAITMPTTLADKIEAQLAAVAAPLSAAALRKLCSVRNATLNSALTDLVATGRIRKDSTGYVIAR